MKKQKKYTKKYGRKLGVLRFEGLPPYSIRATDHAQERMIERKISSFDIRQNVLGLGTERLLALQETQEEAIIIDQQKKLSIVIGFTKNTIYLITVIGTENIWNERGTQVLNV